MKPKILLTAWAARHFDPPPAERTLRVWARDGRIYPAPIKVGRSYYVEQDAQHISEVASGVRLVDRLRRSGV